MSSLIQAYHNKNNQPNKLQIHQSRTMESLANQPEFQMLKYSKGASKELKIGTFFTTLVGVTIALTTIFKAHGKSINPLNCLKKAPKDWALNKVPYDKYEILLLAAGSILGGLAGGALFDKKEHMKAKKREAVIQMIGNIAIPVFSVSLVTEWFNRHESQIQKYLKIDKIKKQFLNKSAKNLLKLTFPTVSLGLGIIVGNKVGNLINEKVFKIKDNRKIKPSDFSAHLDDTCLGISLVAPKGSNFGHNISRLIPAALMVAGYSTGTSKEKPERLNG